MSESARRTSANNLRRRAKVNIKSLMVWNLRLWTMNRFCIVSSVIFFFLMHAASSSGSNAMWSHTLS